MLWKTGLSCTRKVALAAWYICIYILYISTLSIYSIEYWLQLSPFHLWLWTVCQAFWESSRTFKDRQITGILFVTNRCSTDVRPFVMDKCKLRWRSKTCWYHISAALFVEMLRIIIIIITIFEIALCAKIDNTVYRRAKMCVSCHAFSKAGYSTIENECLKQGHVCNIGKCKRDKLTAWRAYFSSYSLLIGERSNRKAKSTSFLNSTQVRLVEIDLCYACTPDGKYNRSYVSDHFNSNIGHFNSWMSISCLSCPWQD